MNAPIKRLPICFAILCWSPFAMAQSDDSDPGKVHPIDAAMEHAMDQNPSTGGQTEAIGDALVQWDRALNQDFAQLMEALDPEGRDRLRNSQKAWIAWRDLEIDALHSVYGKLEGTMWVPASAYAAMNLTRERALRLEFLKSLLTGPELEAQAELDPVELFIRGAKLTIEGSSNRAALRKAFQGFAPETTPSIDDEERLQYDLILVANQAPAAFLFDFAKSGKLERILIDAYMEEQAPPIGTLIEWLKGTAGKPDKGADGSLTWKLGGWSFSHFHGGTGEDSTYRMEIQPH